MSPESRESDPPTLGDRAAAEIFWFIPSGGDGRRLGAASRPASLEYLAQIAQAVDVLGFDGVLLPTGGLNEDTFVVASALAARTQRLRFLVAVRPGRMSPILAARMNASLDRLSGGRAHLNVVSGSGQSDFEGLELSQHDRYGLTNEWLKAFRTSFGPDPVNLQGRFLNVRDGKVLVPSVQQPYPAVYFGGSSAEALAVAAEHADVYLSWGEPPAAVTEKFATVRTLAAKHGRQPRFGLRAHVIVRESEEEAWEEAERLIEHLSDEQIAKAQAAFAASGSEGQRRMAALHHGARDRLRIGRNLWAGIGLVRGGAGTAFVGDPAQIAAAMQEYRDVGVDTFILSGYPHLEEAYRTAELLFPAIRHASALPSRPLADRRPIGRFHSI